MEGIDKITLELLMNKAQYNKYLAIKDPNKYEEVQQHLEKVAKYRNRIMQITDEYCENQNTQNSIELDEAFSIQMVPKNEYPFLSLPYIVIFIHIIYELICHLLHTKCIKIQWSHIGTHRRIIN